VPIARLRAFAPPRCPARSKRRGWRKPKPVSRSRLDSFARHHPASRSKVPAKNIGWQWESAAEGYSGPY